MAGKGPRPGTGGAPRKVNKPRTTDGYRRGTTGPRSAPVHTYAHRIKAGVANAGVNVTVDHLRPGKKAKGTSANIQVVSRAENVRRENRRRAKK